MMRKIRYYIEAASVRMVYCLFRMLSVYTASELGGYLARTIGPYLHRSKIARSNIKKAMPELGNDEIDRIIKGMWDNLGRTLAEFPHMDGLDPETFDKLVVFEGLENIVDACRFKRGSIYFTGHLANWEMTAKSFTVNGHPLTVVVRRGNNPGLEKIVQELRTGYQLNTIPKGQSGARQMLRALKNGKCVGIFIDQKMNDGIKTRFFGLDAMTAPAIARLALKYDYPVLPTRTVRLDGPRHKVTIFPPIRVSRTGDMDKDVVDVMNNINLIMEGWIREHPEQWFWIHNRWHESNEPG